jgi:hypothetical protein
VFPGCGPLHLVLLLGDVCDEVAADQGPALFLCTEYIHSRRNKATGRLQGQDTFRPSLSQAIAKAYPVSFP